VEGNRSGVGFRTWTDTKSSAHSLNTLQTMSILRLCPVQAKFQVKMSELMIYELAFWEQILGVHCILHCHCTKQP